LQLNRVHLEMAKTHKEIIHQSHKRSKEFGLTKESVSVKRFLSEAQVKRLLKDNADLLEITSPIIESLYDFLKGSGFIIILTDKTGRILEIEGDIETLDETSRQSLVPGALMDEKSVGTNAVGTALSENNPIQVTASEHFMSIFQHVTCSACPIHDANGQIVGVLNLTGKSELAHPHTLGLVVATVSAIEYRINNVNIQKQLHNSNQFAFSMMNNLTNGLFAMDLNDHILWVNDTACRTINTRRLDLIDKPIESIFPDWPAVKETILRNEPYADEDNHFSLPKVKSRFLFNAYLIKTKENQILGYILSFRELSGILKMISKLGEHNTRYTFSDFIGESRQTRELIKYCKTISKNPSTVLISGESGTGKEIIAQAIHNASPRQKQAFVAINCGAISESLIESELFGYTEGAFTGAKKGGKTGKFELANNGTLFLDEIGEMPLEMQVKLLRTIQEKAVIRVGSNTSIPVNVRILAATNKNLEEEVKAGRFRLDLYYRLNVFEVHIPALRDRRDDILPLVNHFLKKISSRLDIPIPELKPELLDALLQYNWPGNIRELENLMERAVILRGKLDRNQISHASDAFTTTTVLQSTTEPSANQIFSLEENEKHNILKTIRHFENNISKSAEALGISRNTLYQKMKKYDLLHVSTFGNA
jgi:sigma-54 dependent transcriptional regulator, acetoin dehydrogenase operon transcriptional activator AcoR